MNNENSTLEDYGHSILMTDLIPGYVHQESPWTAIKELKRKLKIDKIFLVIYTDEWQVDYMAVEAWTDKAKAEERAKELTDKKYPNTKNYWYEVEEMELNKNMVPYVYKNENKKL